jgi:hypothetical protein
MPEFSAAFIRFLEERYSAAFARAAINFTPPNRPELVVVIRRSTQPTTQTAAGTLPRDVLAMVKQRGRLATVN